MLSSSATAETNEQTKERTVVPLEVPHDTRICIEDLVDMEIDQLRDDEKKGKQPGDGTQEPQKKTAMDRDPRTRGDKWNAQTRTAQSSSNLSLQCPEELVWAKDDEARALGCREDSIGSNTFC